MFNNLKTRNKKNNNRYLNKNSLKSKPSLNSSSIKIKKKYKEIGYLGSLDDNMGVYSTNTYNDFNNNINNSRNFNKITTPNKFLNDSYCHINYYDMQTNKSNLSTKNNLNDIINSNNKKISNSITNFNANTNANNIRGDSKFNTLNGNNKNLNSNELNLKY